MASSKEYLNYILEQLEAFLQDLFEKMYEELPETKKKK